MATQTQIAANRRNGLKSTGPRTPEGKKRSSKNSLKHGLFASALEPTLYRFGENEADFRRHLKKLREELHPVGYLENILVEKIGIDLWRLRRLYRMESGDLGVLMGLASYVVEPPPRIWALVSADRNGMAGLVYAGVNKTLGIDKAAELKQLITMLREMMSPEYKMDEDSELREYVFQEDYVPFPDPHTSRYGEDHRVFKTYLGNLGEEGRERLLAEFLGALQLRGQAIIDAVGPRYEWGVLDPKNTGDPGMNFEFCGNFQPMLQRALAKDLAMLKALQRERLMVQGGA